MNEVKLFDTEEIRSVLLDNVWYFAVIDVIKVLTESSNPNVYWSNLKKREKQRGIELFTFCKKLPYEAPNKRTYQVEFAEKEGLLRIIQSVPSSKAEPFKLWLANIGSRVLDEKTNKRLAAHRKLKESQNRLFDNIKDRGVDQDGYKRVLKKGDDALFDNQDIHGVYKIDKEEDADDYMNALLLHGKGFAAELTNQNVNDLDLQGEEPISEKHQENNSTIRDVIIDKTKHKPEDIAPEEDLKKSNKNLGENDKPKLE